MTPLDLVKVRRQVDSSLYKSNIQGWSRIYRAEGLRGIFTGWSPTFFGYSAQGAFKYGWYEFFKKQYSDLAGPENAARYKTGLYLAASASAELLADIALCPFEALKVRMQGTMPNPYTGTVSGISSIVAKEGAAGLYKGLYPLWGRQIPYTMMKFASFETIVEMIYNRLPGQKSDYGKAAQTGVSFSAGYLAGILCAIVSHPADVMVSKLNSVREPGEAFGKAMGRIYKDIGFMGLWNGLPVRIVMIGTLTGLQWMIYVSFLSPFPLRLSWCEKDLEMGAFLANDGGLWNRTTSRSLWVSRRPVGRRRRRRRRSCSERAGPTRDRSRDSADRIVCKGKPMTSCFSTSSVVRKRKRLETTFLCRIPCFYFCPKCRKRKIIPASQHTYCLVSNSCRTHVNAWGPESQGKALQGPPAKNRHQQMSSYIHRPLPNDICTAQPWVTRRTFVKSASGKY